LLGLLNIHTREWQSDIIDLSAVKLSSPLLPGTIAGTISAKGAELLGIMPGVPFVLGSLDHHVAAIGAGVGQLADMSESTGTVLACLNYTTTFSPKPNVCTGTGLNADTYYQLAFDNNGAAGLEWYQRYFAPELTLDALGRLATDVPIGSDGLFAKAEAWQFSDLSGFENVTTDHHHGHFFRAIMESTAASLGKLVGFLAGSKFPKRIVATGGGAKSDLWLQMKADLLGTEFITTCSPEPACLGAGLLAALAADWFPDLAAASQQWIKINKKFFPIPDHQQIYAKWYQQHHQIDHTESAR
jgi:xylulokinase